MGTANEPVKTVTYKIYDSAGTLTDEGEGYATDQSFDETLGRFTAGQFQCFDLMLTPGLNSIVVSVADGAGNRAQRTVSYNLDLSSDHTAPTFSLAVPNGGTFNAAKGYYLHGQIDDPSATIKVHIESSVGSYDLIGSVDRTGSFVVDALPLDVGANSVSVTAVDAAGNVSSAQTLSIMRPDVVFTINPMTLAPGATKATVTGMIGNSGYKVWVGGVEATRFQDGS